MPVVSSVVLAGFAFESSLAVFFAGICPRTSGCGSPAVARGEARLRSSVALMLRAASAGAVLALPMVLASVVSVEVICR